MKQLWIRYRTECDAQKDVAHLHVPHAQCSARHVRVVLLCHRRWWWRRCCSLILGAALDGLRFCAPWHPAARVLLARVVCAFNIHVTVAARKMHSVLCVHLGIRMGSGFSTVQYDYTIVYSSIWITYSYINLVHMKLFSKITYINFGLCFGLCLTEMVNFGGLQAVNKIDIFKFVETSINLKQFNNSSSD